MINGTKTRRAELFLLALITAFAACDDPTPTQQAIGVAPASLDIVSGDGQSASPGTELPNPLVVRVLDTDGEPIVDQIVNFRVTSGGGSVFAGTSITNEEGLAQERWTLGTDPDEPQEVEARAVEAATGDKQVFATFTATVSDPSAVVATVTVSPSSANLTVGGTRQFAATAADAEGNPMGGKTFAWSSSNNSVATVSADGLVTARAAGTATITASTDGESDQASVTVSTSTSTDTIPPAIPSKPTLTTTSVNADTFSVTATWGSVGDAAKYAWSTGANSGGFASDGESTSTSVTVRAPLIANSNGYWFCVNAVDAAGNSSENTCNAYDAPGSPPPPPPTADTTVASVTLSPTSASLTVGETRQFSATARNASGSTLSGRTFTWSSSNTAVATVNSNGLVTARAAGSATITASTGGESGQAALSAAESGGGGSSGGDAPEPGSGDAILYQDNFDSYNGIADNDPQPKLESNFAITPTHPSLTSGRGGGKAVRFSYTPSVNDIVIQRQFSSSTDVFIRYWFRTSPGADPTSGGRNTDGFKWFMAHRSSGDRYTMGVNSIAWSAGPSGFTNTGLEFTTHDNGSRQMPNPFVQNISKAKKFGAVNDGQWHKYTIQIRTGNGGFERIWIDGALMLDSSPGAPGVPSGGYDHQSGGINAIGFPGNVVPGVASGYSFTVDVDDLVIWR